MSDTKPFPGLSLEVTVTIAPENVPKFFESFKPAYEAVIAEPECTFFEVFIDPDQPGVIHWVEGWKKDKMWLLGVQMQKDYYKPYLAATEPMFLKPREFKVFEKLPVEWCHVKPEHHTKP
ncbi:hypothetical protein HYFRA_00007770 [Hymenoscyphus fraxineus]|uniref:ABM domain-containing protein n=1 Tax=Hymenoscyphus fraxineus TaxID=746836 RepID=A0A9N9PNA7_9HELO|nr:hypothetical protein HYFRA_00007770 [Hymenoscyphus fraxineus]